MSENEMVPAQQPKPPIMAEQGRGLILTNLDEMWRFADAVSKSGLAPKGLERPESIFVAVQLGAELGLTPMCALQNVAVINGRPSVWGDTGLAMCRASGVFDEEAFEETIVEDEKEIRATCTVRRMPSGKIVSRTFTMDDAKRAGLTGKTGPWTQYPKRMLQMRARWWALRDTFTDVLRGMSGGEELIGAPEAAASAPPAPTTLDAVAKQLTAPSDDKPEAEPAAERQDLDDGPPTEPAAAEKPKKRKPRSDKGKKRKPKTEEPAADKPAEPEAENPPAEEPAVEPTAEEQPAAIAIEPGNVSAYADEIKICKTIEEVKRITLIATADEDLTDDGRSEVERMCSYQIWELRGQK